MDWAEEAKRVAGACWGDVDADGNTHDCGFTTDKACEAALAVALRAAYARGLRDAAEIVKAGPLKAKTVRQRIEELAAKAEGGER